MEPVLKQQFGANADSMQVKVVDKKTEIYKPPEPEKPKFAAFKGISHSLLPEANDAKQDMDASFDTVKPTKIQCDDSKPNTRIQIILIGGKKEAIKVNLSSTVLQIYGHVKALSDTVHAMRICDE